MLRVLALSSKEQSQGHPRRLRLPPTRWMRQIVLFLALGSVLAAACSPDRDSADRTEPAGDTAATDSSGAADQCDPVLPAEPGPVEATLAHDGLDRAYVVHVPEDYDGATPAPMTLNLHGFGGSIEDQDRNGLLDKAGERGYFVITPQGAPLSVPEELPQSGDGAQFEGLAFWNFFGSSGVEFGDEVPPELADLESSALGTDDIGFFDALLDEVISTFCIDPDRVYSAGMSNGAGMSTALGCELGERFAAIAPVSGVNLTGACPGDAPVSVFAIHGDGDDIVVYEGEELMGFALGNPSVPDRMVQWAEHDGCDPEPTVTTDDPYPGVTSSVWSGCVDGTDVVLWTIAGWGHNWPRAATPDDEGVVDAAVSVVDFFDDHVRMSS